MLRQTQRVFAALLPAWCAALAPASAQTSDLLAKPLFEAIRAESSGELPLIHFQTIQTRFSGFAPSKGHDQISDYLAGRAREYGLDVTTEAFPADGRRFFWTFLTEPAWEADVGTLTMIAPRRVLLADFAVHRVVLGRFSSSGDATAELVDVGAGLTPADYAGKDVRGKIVLASGEPGAVHAEAVWKQGAVGLVWYRTVEAIDFPDLISNPTLLPWFGPKGEPTGFAFGLSYARGTELRDMLRRGERVTLKSVVRTAMGPGEYKVVNAVIPGTERDLPEVYIYAHDNYRNTGGANNLSGVGTTVEIARVLNTLIADGRLPRPRRTIRFLWGAEHYGSIYNLFSDPAERNRILAMLNVDMAGFHQERAKAIFRMYRLPYSHPHFLSDVAEDFMHSVGRANSTAIRNAGIHSARPGPGFEDPTFAPSGSRDQFHYAIEPFWGPSDHEDVGDASLGVPSVLYNDWPDLYLGTQQDDITKLDATQLRRSVITVAATAYYLAAASSEAVTTLAPVAVGYAQSRMAAEGRRAATLLTGAEPGSFAKRYREASNLLAQSTAREVAAIETLTRLAESPSARSAIARARKQVEAVGAANTAGFHELATALAADRKLTLATPTPTPTERRLATIVPRRADSLRGPVHFFRPEYGMEWLRQKTGDPDWRGKITLAKRGHYLLYEALNFADGTRSLAEIGDAVGAEYGAVDGADLERYFRFLESVGVVSLRIITPKGR
ncbi:MAG: M28 family peptidase [Gemmatimonadales bacterium]